QPLRTFRLERERALCCPVAVGIRLDHGAHVHSFADMFLHPAKILAQGPQRNFRPGGPPELPDSRFYRRCTHDLAIIEARAMPPDVTLVLPLMCSGTISA